MIFRCNYHSFSSWCNRYNSWSRILIISVVFAKINGKIHFLMLKSKKVLLEKKKIGRSLIEKMIYQIDYIQGIETAEE